MQAPPVRVSSGLTRRVSWYVLAGSISLLVVVGFNAWRLDGGLQAFLRLIYPCGWPPCGGHGRCSVGPKLPWEAPGQMPTCRCQRGWTGAECSHSTVLGLEVREIDYLSSTTCAWSGLHWWDCIRKAAAVTRGYLDGSELRKAEAELERLRLEKRGLDKAQDLRENAGVELINAEERIKAAEAVRERAQRESEEANRDEEAYLEARERRAKRALGLARAGTLLLAVIVVGAVIDIGVGIVVKAASADDADAEIPAHAIANPTLFKKPKLPRMHAPPVRVSSALTRRVSWYVLAGMILGFIASVRQIYPKLYPCGWRPCNGHGKCMLQGRHLEIPVCRCQGAWTGPECEFLNEEKANEERERERDRREREDRKRDRREQEERERAEQEEQEKTERERANEERLAAAANILFYIVVGAVIVIGVVRVGAVIVADAASADNTDAEMVPADATANPTLFRSLLNV